MRILIAGCGYVGNELGRRLLADGDEVFGLRRDVSALAEGIRPVPADLSRLESLNRIPQRIDAAVYAVGAKARDEAAYRAAYLDGMDHFLRALLEQGERPRRVVFTSSTSVYAQRRGEWLDETSPTKPDRFAGDIMLLAERLLAASEIPSTSIRLGGIYGPGRTRMIDRVRAGGVRLRPGPPQYGNRIHRDDAAGAVRHVLRMDDPAPLYVGVDREPAAENDVLRFLAQELGLPEPPVADEDDVEPPRTGSKRCSSRLLREDGYAFLFPTYREGYGALIGAPARAPAGQG